MMSTSPLFQQYQSFKYQHQSVDGHRAMMALADRLRRSSKEWEVDLGEFISQWLDDCEDMELQTSGSTGKPKIIRVSKSAMVHSARRTIRFFGLKKGDKALLSLSTRFIAGKMMVVRALVGELDLMAYGVDSNPLIQLDEEVEFGALVPAQVRCALEQSEGQFKRIRTLLIGGAAVDSKLKAGLEPLPTNFWESYGMTETVSHIALRPVQPGPEVPFTLLDNVSVSIDQRSCLVIEASEVNAERLVTNDVVELLSDKQFILKGRLDNVINSGGVKLFPEEIEAALNSHIDVPFVVSSLPDDKWGEAVVLVLESARKPDIKESVFGLLEKYQKPKAVYCMETFPRTDTGKVKRKELKQMLLERYGFSIDDFD